MSDNTLARVFEPFFTTKEVGRGTGQGLAISRSVVHKHGGTLTFESAVGGGTTFTIRLPIGTKSLEDKASDEALHTNTRIVTRKSSADALFASHR